MFRNATQRVITRRVRHVSQNARSPRPVAARVPPAVTKAEPTSGGQSKGEDNAARVARLRSLPLTLALVTVFGASVYAGMLYVGNKRARDDPLQGPTTQAQLTQVYDRTAQGFDADVNLSERLMGILGWRKFLARSCRGHVLEVSCGTARNLAFYPFGAADGGVRSLTLADLSPEMIEQGKAKWYTLRSTGGLSGTHAGVPVRFWRGDVKGAMPPPPVDQTTGQVPQGYDTIIQSMGLCSTDDPVGLLQNLVGHLNVGNDEARILLLEHGRSWSEWLNRILDTQAPMHASKHGCWWNRDIGEIVAQSGLEIVWAKRKHLGTTWMYALKPAATVQVRDEKAEPVQHGGTEYRDSGGTSKSSSGGWSAWLPRWTYEKICR